MPPEPKVSYSSKTPEKTSKSYELEQQGDDETQKRVEYLEHYKLLQDLITDSTKSFDTTLVTLAAGGLALSIAFVDTIATQSQPLISPWALITSWVCFGTSLLLILFSFYISRRVLEIDLRAVIKEYQGKDGSKEVCCMKWLGHVLEACNVGSLLTFTSGIGFLLTFSIKNLSN
jgi:hypothetical protein